MKLFLIPFFFLCLSAFAIDTVFSQELDFDAIFSDTKKSNQTFILTPDPMVKKEMDENTENVKTEQKIFIGKVIKAILGDGECDLACAEGWCNSINDEDSRFGCYSGIQLAKDNIDSANGWCLSIRDKESRYGCLAGIELAKGNMNSASGWCFSIRDEQSRSGCLAGVELAKGNIDSASGWCNSIRYEDSRAGCLAGVQMAKENIDSARGWCNTIRDEDGKKGCLADLAVASYFIEPPKGEDSANDSISTQYDSEIEQLDDSLSEDITEAKELIKEIEQNPELLDDPEINFLYQELKGEL